MEHDPQAFGRDRGRLVRLVASGRGRYHVLALAAEHGLVCYEPGYHVVNPNAPGYVSALHVVVGELADDARPRRAPVGMDRRSGGGDNGYVILERADGWFVQVGYGDAAGVPAGTYALEYREGSMDRHFRYQTTDREAAVRLLQGFRVGDETWKRLHPWEPL